MFLVFLFEFFPFVLLLFFYSFCQYSFSRISRDIFHKYISLITLKTDWKSSFLDFCSDNTRKYFHAHFISLLTISNQNQARFLSSTGDNSTNFLIDAIEKHDIFLQRNNSLFPFTYKTESALFPQKKEDSLREYGLRYSFMIPIYFENNKEEAMICLYFKNPYMMLYSYIKYIILLKKINYFYAGIFRTFVRSFDNSSDFLLEEIEDYVAISLDRNSRVVAWNKGSEKLFSYNSLEIIGKPFIQLFQDEEKEAFTKSLEILKVKNDVKYFATLKDKMNIPIKVELKIKKMNTITNELAGYSIFVKDITKEEIFKDNIHQHSFINYTILENSQDAILILDSQDKIIFYNQRIRTIFDNSMNLFGIPGKKIFPRRFGEEFEKTINHLKETKLEFHDIDYCFDNSYYNIRFFRVHKNSNNEYGGVIVFFIDESIRMITMLELEEKKEALENINKNLLDALASARIMQKNLIPKTLPKEHGLLVDAIYELSDDLGGDYYFSENIELNNQQYNISFISDVSGHGISSSMMNVMVKEVYQSFIDQVKTQEDLDPFCFLQLLNKKILSLDVIENKFITCITAITNLTQKLIKISSAGHTLPFILNEDKYKLLNFKRAVPLGVMENIKADIYELNYKKGDRLILYTDGFLELFEIDDQKPSDSACNFLNDRKEISISDLKVQILNRYQFLKEEQFSSADDLTILFFEFV